MALADPYASVTDVKARLKVTDAVDDAVLTQIVASVRRELEGYTGRQFNLDIAASARHFYAAGINAVGPWTTQASPTTLMTRGWADYVFTDEFTSAGFALATDEDDDGTYETVWSSTDYQLEPIDGIVDGVPGNPYNAIRAVSQVRRFPISGRDWTSRRRPGIQVTATWGWPSVPEDIREAAILLSIETFKFKDAPFGVAGFSEFGAVRVGTNPKIAGLLKRYVRGGGLQFA